MSKKKKSQKKHQFKYAEAKSATASPAQSSANLSAPTSSAAAKQTSLGYQVANLELIKGDVRKVLVLAGSFVLLQLVLWFVFGHTSLGSGVYHLIKT